MELAIIGISHKQLSLDQRSIFNFTDTCKLEFSSLLLNYGIEQVVILATCNRSEVYIMYEDEIEFLPALYLHYFNQDKAPLYLKTGDAALEHLLSVTCGLESMLLREDQILGQVKQAYEFARAMNLGGKEIYLLFQETLSFVKMIKHKYPQPSLSLTHLAIEHLKKDLVLTNQKIMICGAGEIAVSFIPYLYDNNELILSNRNNEKVLALKDQYPKIKTISFNQRKILLDQIDILISATASPHEIFLSEDFKDLKIHAIDLTIPRDIDKNASIPCIDLDTLNQEVSNNNQQRNEDIQKIKAEILIKITELKNKLDSIKYDYMIQSLQAKSLQLANQTYDILTKKLSLTKRESYILEKTLKASFMQIMKDPIHCVKTNQINDLEVINKLFSLKEEE